MSFWSCGEKPKLNWRPSCSEGKNSVSERDKRKKFVVSLSTRKFGRYWRSLFFDLQLPDFFPFSLSFPVMIVSWLTPEGLGPHFFLLVHPSPSLSLSSFFFFLKVRTSLMGKVGDGFWVCRFAGIFFWRKGIRDCRVCVVVCLGWVVRFVIVFDYASPMCSVSLLNWVFQWICLFVKFV